MERGKKAAVARVEVDARAAVAAAIEKINSLSSSKCVDVVSQLPLGT